MSCENEQRRNYSHKLKRNYSLHYVHIYQVQKDKNTIRNLKLLYTSNKSIVPRLISSNDELFFFGGLACLYEVRI